MRYVLTRGAVRQIAIKITRRLYEFCVALSYFQTRLDVYHVLSDDILRGDVCFELTGHSQRRRRDVRARCYSPSSASFLPCVSLPPSFVYSVLGTGNASRDTV